MDDPNFSTQLTPNPVGQRPLGESPAGARDEPTAAGPPARPRAKRRRGGQPGNLNALKHGFYSRLYRSLETQDLGKLDASGLEQEIVLLRVLMRRTLELAEDGEELERGVKLLAALGLASARLAGLLRTQAGLGESNRNALEAIRAALAEASQAASAWINGEHESGSPTGSATAARQAGKR